MRPAGNLLSVAFSAAGECRRLHSENMTSLHATHSNRGQAEVCQHLIARNDCTQRMRVCGDLLCDEFP